MKATKERLSLETGKLLNDCVVESKEYFASTPFPAFTWQEILWEHAEKFFSGCSCYDCNSIFEVATIILLLQQKKYEEADLYFREHCILINSTQ